MSRRDEYNSSFETDDAEFDFQGMDRLINSMMGIKWRISIVCEPVDNSEIRDVPKKTKRSFHCHSICIVDVLMVYEFFYLCVLFA